MTVQISSEYQRLVVEGVCWWEYGKSKVLAIMKVRPGDRSFETVLHQRIPRTKAASVVIATLDIGFVLILVMQSTLLSIRIICCPFPSLD